MNIILLGLTTFVVTYIAFCALKHAFKLVFSFSIFIACAASINHYGSQSDMLVFLALSPVLYVVSISVVKTFSTYLRSIMLYTIGFSGFRLQVTFDWLKSAFSTRSVVFNQSSELEIVTLKGEWIGNNPELTFQQSLLGDVKALPRPWL